MAPDLSCDKGGRGRNSAKTHDGTENKKKSTLQARLSISGLERTRVPPPTLLGNIYKTIVQNDTKMGAMGALELHTERIDAKTYIRSRLAQKTAERNTLLLV